jgi:mannose-6-phosphate isomerase
VTVLGPLHLRPRLVPKPWGGRRLAALGRDLGDDASIGESWDVADLDETVTSVADPVTRVLAGPAAGRSLRELVRDRGEELLGTAEPAAGRFPLLVKHIDAREHLSVQVHPPQQTVARHPGSHMKTESWVVVAADPGAELFLGVDDGVTVEDVSAAIGGPAVVPLLRRVPARVGDVHHLPAGLVHALGAGVVVAEVQTPSDTTYRLYDWTEEYRRAPRRLDPDRAMESVAAGWEFNTRRSGPAVGDGIVVDTPHYRITRTTLPAGGAVPVPTREVGRVVVVVTGRLGSPELDRDLGPAGVVVLPAAWAGHLTAGPGTAWLDVDLIPAR